MTTAISKAAIVRQLRQEVRMYRQSYRERDGVVRDEGAIRTIAALRGAIKIVQTSKKP